MSQNTIKNGYVGYDEMGKPIPDTRRKAACEKCKEFGCDTATAEGIVSQIAMFLERNKPHEALIAGRQNISISVVYMLIAVLMTGEI